LTQCTANSGLMFSSRRFATVVSTVSFATAVAQLSRLYYQDHLNQRVTDFPKNFQA
jgi:hypothetical protein